MHINVVKITVLYIKYKLMLDFLEVLNVCKKDKGNHCFHLSNCLSACNFSLNQLLMKTDC